MPDSTLSAAIREAYASAPASEIVYHTMELWHPAWSEPVRVVRDWNTLRARLEAGAPRNASQWVDFVPFAFDFSLPDVTAGALPEIVVTVDNAGAELVSYLDAAANSADKVELIYRPYLESDLSAPNMNPPLTLYIREIGVDVLRITARAGYTDLGNRKFPNQLYTSERFPGLIA